MRFSHRDLNKFAIVFFRRNKNANLCPFNNNNNAGSFNRCVKYIIQNLDDVFERPGWSAVCEYDATWRGYHRFMSAFLLIEPSLKVYEEIL